MQQLPPLAKLNPAEAWKPWQPTAADPWSLKWAGHLYRRAAFGGTSAELREAVKDGLEATLNRLFTPGEGQAQFDQAMDYMAPETGQYQPFNAENDALQGWWLHRMIATVNEDDQNRLLFPFRERMTLFWHNHFATSVVKVRLFALMKRQNLLIRKHALGKFRPFLLEMSRDPAMLVWLDSNSNVKGKPNENYARELMELFSLGVGNYTEKDIREAARAFTGWHTTGQPNDFSGTQTGGPEFTFNKYQHDDGPKTVLGQTGNWDGGDIVRIVLDQPAAIRFLVRKLYRHFISEAPPLGSPPSEGGDIGGLGSPPSEGGDIGGVDSLLEPLADQLRKSDYNIAALMRTMLGSRHFFSAYAHRQRVKSPVEFLAGMLRSLELDLDIKGEGIKVGLAIPMDGLGQTLFAPPSVKGWDGGRAWLNSATLLARHNMAWRFVLGVQGPYGAKVNPATLVQKYADGQDSVKQVDFLLDLLLQPGPGEVDKQARQKLVEFLAKDTPRGTALERRLRETTHAILLMPEYQLA